MCIPNGPLAQNHVQLCVSQTVRWPKNTCIVYQCLSNVRVQSRPTKRFLEWFNGNIRENYLKNTYNRINEIKWTNHLLGIEQLLLDWLKGKHNCGKAVSWVNYEEFTDLEYHFFGVVIPTKRQSSEAAVRSL